MSKAVLMSFAPDPCTLIEAGLKKVEARKTKPKLKPPFKVYIYETLGKRIKLSNCIKGTVPRGCGKVIGEFVCDKMIWVVAHPSIFAGHPLFYQQALEDACLTQDEAEKYSGGKDVIGWHISDLVIYDKPRVLSAFGLARAPQSWCYVEELEAAQ